MSFIDIDEYIVPVEGENIPDALQGLEQVSNISLPWTMFGMSGQTKPPEEPAIYAYETCATTRRPEITNFKCIVDPCDVTRVSTHKFWTHSMGAATVNDQGQKAANHKARRADGFATTDRLQLNHYYTFSQAELNRKLSRETVSHQAAGARADAVHRMAEWIEADTKPDTTARDFLTRKGIANWRDFRSV